MSEIPNTESSTADSLSPEMRAYLSGYLADLKESQSKNNDLFEKQLSYIAGGTLAVSPFILERLVDFHQANFKLLLFTAWLLVISSLMSGLISAYKGVNLIRKSVLELNAALLNRGAFNSDVSNRRFRIIEILNISSIIFLMAGIILFFTFIGLNQMNMSEEKFPKPTETSRSIIKKGYVPSNLVNIDIQHTQPATQVEPTNSNSQPNDSISNTNSAE